MNGTERELAAALRREEHELDARTVARISAVRREALSAPHPPWIQRWFAPAAGAAVLAGVLGIGVFLPQSPLVTEPQRPSPEQVAENPEFYQDLDFYLWLADSDLGNHG
jgi:hypothetical protein